MWTTAEWHGQALAGAKADPAQVRNMVELRLELLRDRGSASLDESSRDLLRFHRERHSAVPDLSRYPELRGMRELLLAENRGYQEGAGLTDLELAAYISGYAYYHRFIASKPAPAASPLGKANCSWIFFPASDRGPLAANNLDSTPRQLFSRPCWPAHNEHVFMGGVSSGLFMDELSPELFPAPVYRLVSRYCRSADETVDLLTRYTLFWGPGNLLVADRNRRTAMIEKSACRIGVRWSPDGFGFVTAMTAEEPGMHAYVAGRRAASVAARGLPAGNLDECYWAKQDARRELMNGLMDEARRRPTFEAMRRFIQFRDPVRGNVCGFGEPVAPGGPASEYTIRTVIWELRERRARWWAQDGDTPSWERPMPDETFPDESAWDGST
jgi:hypothetical protein